MFHRHPPHAPWSRDSTGDNDGSMLHGNAQAWPWGWPSPANQASALARALHKQVSDALAKATGSAWLQAPGTTDADTAVAPASPVTATTPASLPAVGADQQTVVILDTGLSTHIGNLIYQYDFYAQDGNAQNRTASDHGTLVASQVLAADRSVNLVMLKVAADGSDTLNSAAIERALDWVAAHAKALNVAAVNLSFGDSQLSSTASHSVFSDRFARLQTLDVAVVVAAGNNGAKSALTTIASGSNVIAVSASNGDGVFASFSNRDADLTDLVADGVGIVSGNARVSGTSFAAPQVAGAIAHVKDAFFTTYGRELTVSESLQLLQATGDRMNTAGEVPAEGGGFGKGYVQLDLAQALDTISHPAELALIGIHPGA